MRVKAPLFVVLLSIATSLAWAAGQTEDGILKSLKQAYPSMDFTEVRSSSVPGIYEVDGPGRVAFTDKTGSYLFPTVIEVKTHKDLGAERAAALRPRMDFKSLPFQDAIKIVKGNGRRTMAVFSDPECPFCKRLEGTFTGLNDVTIYVFEYPIESLHQGSTSRAVSLWCSANRDKAWVASMLYGENPAPMICDNPVLRNVALGRKLSVNGTPTMFFSDGEQIYGAVDLKTIENALAKSEKN